MFFVILFTIIWLIVTSKNIFFWIYLWQLKNYHIGRFRAHFQLEKGKKLIINRLLFLKILLASFFILIFASSLLFLGVKGSLLLVFVMALLALVYLLEALWTIKNIIQNKFKFPVLTLKTIALIIAALAVESGFAYLLFKKFGYNYPFLIMSLLIFDVFIPLIVSLIVLLLQPFTVLRRRQIISMAKKRRRQFKDLIVIGITGSYGKTTTKEFLAAILSQKFNVLKTREHENSEMGISRCILEDLNSEHQVFIVEMGAYNRGGIKYLCEIANPKIGILTGINEQHLATFGSQENIIKAKFELIESLPANGTAILNCDSQYVKEKVEDPNYKLRVKKQIFYSTQQELDFWADSISTLKDSISFRVSNRQKESVVFSVGVLGSFNVSNILAAVAAARELGMSLDEIAGAARKIKMEQGSIVLKKNGLGLNLIDFTYSANADGVISALDYLKTWSGRKAIIMPCLIELDTAARSVHERIGDKIAEVCDLAVITTKDYFKDIRRGAIENKMNPEKIVLEEDPEKIMERVRGFDQENDIILLEGRLAKDISDLLLKK